MAMGFKKIKAMLNLSGASGIMRRYFVVNGFDGALTSLGLLMGFYVSTGVDLVVVMTTCLAASLALGMSGVSSAYITEAAERRRHLSQLEGAMLAPLDNSYHARAEIWSSWLVALVNGIAPLAMAFIIIIPLWLGQHDLLYGFDPLLSAMIVALMTIFLLGVFLGWVGGTFWLWSGLQSLTVALLTLTLIYLIN